MTNNFGKFATKLFSYEILPYKFDFKGVVVKKNSVLCECIVSIHILRNYVIGISVLRTRVQFTFPLDLTAIQFKTDLCFNKLKNCKKKETVIEVQTYSDNCSAMNVKLRAVHETQLRNSISV